MRKVFVRADGNAEIGLGHVIRSCAVAEMLCIEFDCYFYIRQPSEYLKNEIRKAGCHLVEMGMTESYEEEAEAWSKTLTGNEIVILDGYNFGTYYQQQIKKCNCRLICIDDLHSYSFLADVIINQAGGIAPSNYSSLFYTQYFLGPKYSLIRKEFLSRRRIKASPKTVFICLGGADPKNDTIKVLERVSNAAFESVNLLIGSGYLYKQELEKFVNRTTLQPNIYQNINAEQVAQLMQSCSHAILSPSSISYEYMSFSGVVYLYQIANNQQYTKKYFIDNGLAFDFVEFGKKSFAEEKEMIKKQKQYFDGKSANRIIKIFENILLIDKSYLRKACQTDTAITFSWANDDLARQMSFNMNKITEIEHLAWFSNRLRDSNSHYYIFEIDKSPMAQIRFDYKDGFYLLSYFIDEAYRGKGLGSFIVAEGIKRLKTENTRKSTTIIGYVKSTNVASCLAFERMKFRKEKAQNYNDSFKYMLEI